MSDQPQSTATVADISDDDLLERAVRNARVNIRYPHHRWVAVRDLFALGSTYARQLCQRYNLDPDELVKS